MRAFGSSRRRRVTPSRSTPHRNQAATAAGAPREASSPPHRRPSTSPGQIRTVHRDDGTWLGARGGELTFGSPQPIDSSSPSPAANQLLDPPRRGARTASLCGAVERSASRSSTAPSRFPPPGSSRVITSSVRIAASAVRPGKIACLFLKIEHLYAVGQ